MTDATNGATTTTAADATYSLVLPAGTAFLEVSDLPPECVAPGARSGAIAPDSRTTLDLAIDCAPPRPAVSLSVTGSPLALVPGASDSLIAVISRSSFVGAVHLGVRDLPSGVSATVTPPVLAGSDSTSTVVLHASPTAPSGSATISINASGPGVATSQTASVTVLDVTTIALDFCAEDPAVWFAYQNEGKAWTAVTPDGEGTVTFGATPKVGLAIVRRRRNLLGQAGSAFITTVLYVTAAELEPLSGAACLPVYGNRAVHGTVAGLGTGESARIGIAGLNFSGAESTFTATHKPDAGALDVVAARLNGHDNSSEPVSFIVRRGIALADGDTLPVLDFGTSEAVTAGTWNYAITGLSGFDDRMLLEFFTNTGGTALSTYVRAVSRCCTIASTGTFPAVPPSLTVPGDRHELTAQTGPPSDTRGATAVFRNGADVSLALGPSLATPTFSPAGSSPYPRIRVQVASQSEYSGLIRVMYGARNIFTIDASSGYVGGTPGTWDITIPDLSGASGWNNAWALTSGDNLTTVVTSWNRSAVAIPPSWASPLDLSLGPAFRPLTEGTTLLYASRRGSFAAP